MREFLYVSPLFPPRTEVGALRPLKFLRHLSKHGWRAVVLADRGRGPGSSALERCVPDGVRVAWEYADPRPPRARVGRSTPRVGRSTPRAPGPLAWLSDPDVFPIVAELPGLRRATKAGLRILESSPDIEAIMVNADPYGALLVGAGLARASGLPLVLDLRDPWSQCSLRRARRPALAQRWVEWLERSAFARASAIILNTETALEAYRAAYRDFDPSLFCCIRNHHDRELNWLDAGGEVGPLAGDDKASLLFLGGFRRHVEGDVLLEVLSRLKARGLGDRVRLVVTGRLIPETWAAARRMGVEEMLLDHPFVPLTETGPVMEAADVLVALNNRTDQRIMAKLYDYATSTRPVLVMARSPELERLCAQVKMQYVDLEDVDAAAAWLAERLSSGRPAAVPRDVRPLSSEAATARLAAILDAVTAA